MLNDEMDIAVFDESALDSLRLGGIRWQKKHVTAAK